MYVYICMHIYHLYMLYFYASKESKLKYCKRQRVNIQSESKTKTQKIPLSSFFLIFSSHNFPLVSLTFPRDIIFLSSANFSSDGLKGSGAPSETRL